MTFVAVAEGDAGGWRAERGALTEVIRARWAEVEIDWSARIAVRSLIWELDTANGPGEAYPHEDGTCLYMDVWEEDAIWIDCYAWLASSLHHNGCSTTMCRTVGLCSRMKRQ